MRRLAPLAALAGLVALASGAACRSRSYHAPSQSSYASPPRTAPYAPPPPAASAGTFQGQAAQGARVHAASCARCHGTGGEGGQGPALVGSGALPSAPPAGRKFRTSAFRTVGDVVTFVETSMPPGGPRISHDDALAVVAFALTANGVNLDRPLDTASASATPFSR